MEETKQVMKAPHDLTEALKNAPNRVSEAQYVTASRKYVRYYIELQKAPQSIVIYVDSETGQILSNPRLYEGTLKL